MEALEEWDDDADVIWESDIDPTAELSEEEVALAHEAWADDDCQVARE